MTTRLALQEHQEASPSLTICVLCHGSHTDLVNCLKSIRQGCQAIAYRVLVAASAPDRRSLCHLENALAAGTIQDLIISSSSLNKTRIMRQMFALIETDLIWWLTDDCRLTQADTGTRWLEVAKSAPSSVVQWGHQFFYGNESDFSGGRDVVQLVKKASWYRGMEPPSWTPGGKGETDFEGRGVGDGRWFFIADGCWMIRTSAVRALDWPDLGLRDEFDNVILAEAIRQQGWGIMDVGQMGVSTRTGERATDWEHEHDHQKSQSPLTPTELKFTVLALESVTRFFIAGFRKCEGAVFLPTFEDVALLEENFSNRIELNESIDFHVLDDNFDVEESGKVRALCADNGWTYHKSTRAKHGDMAHRGHDLTEWNRVCWGVMGQLAEDYEYVVKVDTDAYLITHDWHEEIGQILRRRTAYAGSPEWRNLGDTTAFWAMAAAAGYDFEPSQRVMHVQGGISGYSQKCLQRLKEMGFLEGRHEVTEDCYLSYACQLLGIPFLRTKTIGSWWHPYRPALSEIQELRAIHPLTHSEWRRFCRGDPA